MNSDDWTDHERQDGGVRILELGAGPTDALEPAPTDRPHPSRHRPFALAVILGVGLLAGFTLAPLINDTPLHDDSEAPVTTKGVEVPVLPSACTAVEQAEQDEPGSARPNDNASVSNLPSGYSLYGVMTSQDTSSFIGLVHADGFVQICEEAAQRAPFEVQFPPQADLGQLPEGMIYAYAKSNGFTENRITLDVAGVRLPDGTVVKSLTLLDGRSVPAAPVSEQ